MDIVGVFILHNINYAKYCNVQTGLLLVFICLKEAFPELS